MTPETLIVLIVMGFASLVTLFCVGIAQFKSIILQKEQIKADALVRSEEIKARNQFELEKLIRHDQANQRKVSGLERFNGSDEDRVVRERIND